MICDKDKSELLLKSNGWKWKCYNIFDWINDQIPGNPHRQIDRWDCFFEQMKYNITMFMSGRSVYFNSVEQRHTVENVT